jgi:putative nucleotidyltransferase with HDIG domain
MVASSPAQTLVAADRRARAERDITEKLSTGKGALPVLPRVASQALLLANDAKASITQFAKLIESDPPIAARFLALANSALYSRGTTIRTALEATARIGMASSRDLIFQVVYATNLAGVKRFRREVQQCYDRSVKCATLCRVASRLLHPDLRDAYLCGLLHDIGESRVYRLLDDHDVLTDDEAKQLVQHYHPRAGVDLAERWGLPVEIIQVCREHEGKPLPQVPAVRLVQLSHVLLPAVASEKDGWKVELEEHLAALNVSRDEALGIVAAARAQLTA